MFVLFSMFSYSHGKGRTRQICRKSSIFCTCVLFGPLLFALCGVVCSEVSMHHCTYIYPIFRAFNIILWKVLWAVQEEQHSFRWCLEFFFFCFVTFTFLDFAQCSWSTTQGWKSRFHVCPFFLWFIIFFLFYFCLIVPVGKDFHTSVSTAISLNLFVSPDMFEEKSLLGYFCVFFFLISLFCRFDGILLYCVGASLTTHVPRKNNLSILLRRFLEYVLENE